jgi:hypothetical protein
MYAIEVTSYGMIYIPSFMKIGTGEFKSIHIRSVTLFTSIKVNGPSSVTSALNLLIQAFEQY